MLNKKQDKLYTTTIKPIIILLSIMSKSKERLLIQLHIIIKKPVSMNNKLKDKKLSLLTQPILLLLSSNNKLIELLLSIMNRLLEKVLSNLNKKLDKLNSRLNKIKDKQHLTIRLRKSLPLILKVLKKDSIHSRQKR
jgi:hypothetical protein